MGSNSLPKTVTRQRRKCDLNPGPSLPESSTLTTQLPSTGTKFGGWGSLMLRAKIPVTRREHLISHLLLLHYPNSAELGS